MWYENNSQLFSEGSQGSSRNQNEKMYVKHLEYYLVLTSAQNV